MKTISDATSGDLGVIEFQDLPFAPKRVYWIRNFQLGSTRGNHAHRHLSQIAIVLQGRLIIDLFDGNDRTSHELSVTSDYLEITPGKWRVMRDAAPGTVLMVLASLEYDESDYIRDWNTYLKWHESTR